jgi:hypothetical protein
MNPTKLLRPVVAALALGAAAVGGAATASASAPAIDFTQHHPVPPGQVQHLVTENITSHEGEGTHHRRTENWTATAASRTIVSNVDTGRVTYECGSTGVDWSCYFPDDNVLEHGSGNDPLVNASWRDQAGFWKQEGARSGYTRVGRSVDVGRPVTVYTSTSKVAYLDDMVPITETIDIDDELGFIMRNTISSPFPDGTTLRSETVVTTMETLTSAPVALGTIARPGAKSKRVTGKRLPAGAKQSPAKQKSKSKAKAKKKATKKKRKATQKSAGR